MDRNKILSICIATYNRAVQLEELVKSLLSVKSDDFEVVITNNCSTDNTLAMLDSIEDDRLVVHSNQSPIPGLYNIIESIFNANGKYALYCNDRDVIFVERLLSFIDFLRKHEYSFLHIVKNYGNPTYKLIEYEKGFDSLIHHPYCDHPTGMVFNVELMKNNLYKEDYVKYVQVIYPICFLLRDIVVYMKSAEYDNYLWDERPSIFKVQSASGSVYKGQLFFETEKTFDIMKEVVTHLINNSHFLITKEQQKALILDIFQKLSKRLIMKKYYYADKRECAHYGVKTRYISFLEMKDAYNRYLIECDRALEKTGYSDDLKNEWSRLKNSIKKSLLKTYIRSDFSIILIKLRRTLFRHYRY